MRKNLQVKSLSCYYLYEVKNMSANRIKEIRAQRGLKQTDVASQVGVSERTYIRYENGVTEPKQSVLERIAQVLGVSTDALMATENKKAPADMAGEGAKTRRIISMEDWIQVPIVSREWTACCGEGITAEDITSWDEGLILFPRTELRALDDLRRPFAVHCDGDCMESAGILDGDLAVINPAEEPLQGTVVLVSIGGSLSLKRYYLMPNGDVILKSDHEPIRLTPEEQERDEFTICGVLAGTHRGRPKAWPL